MRGLNKVILLGNLGSEPECRVLNSGTSVASASLGTSKSRKQQDGSYAEQTEWHRLVFWGKIAETVQQYLHKGSRIYVEGEIRSRQYQDQQGQTKHITEIHVSEMLMLSGQKQGGNGGYQNQPPMSQQWDQPPMQQPMQTWQQPPMSPMSGTQSLDMAVAANERAMARAQAAQQQQQGYQTQAPAQSYQQQPDPRNFAVPGQQQGFQDDPMPF